MNRLPFCRGRARHGAGQRRIGKLIWGEGRYRAAPVPEGRGAVRRGNETEESPTGGDGLCPGLQHHLHFGGKKRRNCMRRFLTAFAAAVLMLSLGTADAAEYKKMTIRAATANPQAACMWSPSTSSRRSSRRNPTARSPYRLLWRLARRRTGQRQTAPQRRDPSRGAGGREPDALRAAGGVFILPYMFPKISDAKSCSAMKRS